MATQNRLIEQDEAVRTRQRLLLSTPVCLLVQRPRGVQLVSARFRDVSGDGAAIFAGVELPVDSDIQIEFTPPTNEGPLRVRAVIRNRRQYVYGVEFLPKDGREEQILQTLKTMLLSAGTEAYAIAEDRRWS